MAKMAQEQSGGKEPGEIVKTENKTKETKLAKVQPQVSIIEINIAKTHCQKCGHKKYQIQVDIFLCLNFSPGI